MPDVAPLPVVPIKPYGDITPGTLVQVPMAAPSGGMPDAPHQPPVVAGAPVVAPVPASVVAVQAVHWWQDPVQQVNIILAVVSCAQDIYNLQTSGTLNWFSALKAVGFVAVGVLRLRINSVNR